MDRYVGVDAHAESCTLGVLGGSGKRLKSMVVETNGRALVGAIRSIPGRVHVCLEEGTQSAWLYELLKPHAEEIVVTVPAESKGAKDDARDAWARADELRTGALRTRVYKAPVHMAGLRNAARAYSIAVQDTVRVKNRVKAVLRSRGIQSDGSVYEVSSRARWRKKLPSGHREFAEWLGRELAALSPLREEAEERLLEEAKAHPIIKKLSTAPGLGTIRTAQLVAIVVTPHRFRTVRQFWSYSGPRSAGGGPAVPSRRFPDDVEVYVEVAVDDPVARSGDLAPGHLRMRPPSRIRHTPDRLADDLDVADHSILGLRVGEEHLPTPGGVLERAVDGAEHLGEVEPLVALGHQRGRACASTWSRMIG